LNTPTFIYPVLAVLLAYLLGSLSFAVIVSRVMGLNDPRTYGSKNPGATNVLRSGSRKAAVATLLLDAVKGWLPVALVRWWGPAFGLEDGTLAMVGLAAFLGHLFPVFFRFVGGKGVATALGVLVGVSPWLGLATGLVWLVVVVLTRYSSLSSLLAAVSAPVLYIMGDGTLWVADRYGVLSLVLMSALLVWRHAANIDRLLKGTESKVGGKKKA
jgi:acyl phosphate:glycerol-3-phosphate acyltransferase